ncbi:PIN2/TERF1-interacting telomerase inhibitor 1, variant 2 [Orbilia ellipsospora]
MLTSQGWSPGTILGPDPHNPHHTAASQIGIKVTLKDDNLGLGCKGTQEDTCTGLGDLQSLLGRLNGKAVEEVREEEDARRKVWVEGRFGMRFVRGEVLESTWVTKELKKGKEEDTVMGESESADAEKEDNSSDEEKDDGKKGSSKKDKKRKSSAPDSEQDEESSSSSEKDHKSDKAKRKAEKAKRKAERLAKRERKEAKRLRKDEKRRAKAEKKALKSVIAASLPSSTASTPPALPSAQPEPVSKAEKKAKSLPNSVSTSGTSTPTTGRQALRSKWIAQKRMAVMDAKALNEILMIKAA